MEGYKQKSIEFMVENKVSKFSDFTPRSEHKSPFSMNAGSHVTDTRSKELGEYYVKAVHDNLRLGFDVFFGPAYRGVPLSVATAIATSDLYGKDIRYCSNRKGVEDRGDTGILLGSSVKDGDQVMIIENVTTPGKSIEETFPIPRVQGDVEIGELIMSPDRCERDKGTKSALAGIKDLYGLPAAAIVPVKGVVEHLYNKECEGNIVINDQIKTAINAYYQQYDAQVE